MTTIDLTDKVKEKLREFMKESGSKTYMEVEILDFYPNFLH